MTIGGTFWMGLNYWRKTRQELVKLQYTSVTPETIEDYYRAIAKAVRKVGVSIIILHSCSVYFRSSIAFLKCLGWGCSYLELPFVSCR